MQHWIKHVRRRELHFLLLMLANLACIGGYLTDGVGGMTSAEHGGWRRIDIKAVEARLKAGDLVRKEADWYHTLSEEEPAKP